MLLCLNGAQCFLTLVSISGQYDHRSTLAPTSKGTGRLQRLRTSSCCAISRALALRFTIPPPPLLLLSSSPHSLSHARFLHQHTTCRSIQPIKSDTTKRNRERDSEWGDRETWMSPMSSKRESKRARESERQSKRESQRKSDGEGWRVEADRSH